MKYPMSIRDALVYERILLEEYKQDILYGKASAYEKELYDVKLTAVSNLQKLSDKYGDAWVDADGEVIGNPATSEEIEEHVNLDVRESNLRNAKDGNGK